MWKNFKIAVHGIWNPAILRHGRKCELVLWRTSPVDWIHFCNHWFTKCCDPPTPPPSPYTYWPVPNASDLLTRTKNHESTNSRIWFTNLIGWNGYWQRSRFSHLDRHLDRYVLKWKTCKLKCKIIDCFYLKIFISVSAKRADEKKK